MTRLTVFVLLFSVAACKQRPDDTGDTATDTATDTAVDDTGGDTQDTEDTDDTQDTDVEVDSGDPGPLGFIGAPCDTVGDCDYDGAVCLRAGYPAGMCSYECDQYCDDMDGRPVTFCVDDAGLDGDASVMTPGACHSRCDFDVFPETGCRPSYGCVVEPRANQTSTVQYVCMPDAEPDLSQCYYDLAARGVAFEPTIKATEHPADYPELDCTIEDPLYLLPPIQGVDLRYYDGSASPRMLLGCEAAHSIIDTIEDVKPHGVDVIRHIGTYNCRPISGTSTLSQHSFANAIDIYGFEFTNGDLYTLIDDWEHDTTNPSTAAGQFLYDTAWRWYDDSVWNIILTPNYNAAHDNHFHVDMTPGADYIGSNGDQTGPINYIGPMEHDCGGPGRLPTWTE